jgi:Primase C terminal 2 (PriCT-2)
LPRPADAARVADALAHIPAEDYDDWLKVGMALHHSGEPWARGVWDTWSQQSDKFDADTQEKSWASFGARNKVVTLGSLFYLASQQGWRPPEPAILPDDDPQAQAGIAAHRLPDHLRDHHDPRVRQHWTRIYRKANALKQRLMQDPYSTVHHPAEEGASYDPR